MHVQTEVTKPLFCDLDSQIATHIFIELAGLLPHVRRDQRKVIGWNTCDLNSQSPANLLNPLTKTVHRINYHWSSYPCLGYMYDMMSHPHPVLEVILKVLKDVVQSSHPSETTHPSCGTHSYQAEQYHQEAHKDPTMVFSAVTVHSNDI